MYLPAQVRRLFEFQLITNILRSHIFSRQPLRFLQTHSVQMLLRRRLELPAKFSLQTSQVYFPMLREKCRLIMNFRRHRSPRHRSKVDGKKVSTHTSNTFSKGCFYQNCRESYSQVRRVNFVGRFVAQEPLPKTVQNQHQWTGLRRFTDQAWPGMRPRLVGTVSTRSP